MTVALIDVIFLIVMVIVAIGATIKGFIHEFFGKVAFFLGLLCAVLFYDDFTPIVMKYVKTEFLAPILSFLLIFIIIYLIISIIKVFVGKLFQGEVMGGLNRLLGFFFGAAEGLLIVAVIIILLTAQPWIDVSRLFANSIFFGILKGFLVEPTNYLNNIVIVYNSAGSNIQMLFVA
jgi:membrane protein required for colicin V production